MPANPAGRLNMIRDANIRLNTWTFGALVQIDCEVQYRGDAEDFDWELIEARLTAICGNGADDEERKFFKQGVTRYTQPIAHVTLVNVDLDPQEIANDFAMLIYEKTSQAAVEAETEAAEAQFDDMREAI
jgi:hypothetical protein